MSQYTTFTDKFPLPVPSFRDLQAGLTVAAEISETSSSGLAGSVELPSRLEVDALKCPEEKMRKQLAYLYRNVVYLCKRGRSLQPRFRFVWKSL
jgi:hypothetical protein